MKIGSRVKLSGPVRDTIRDMIGDKEGVIIDADQGLFDWVVYFEGTRRLGGCFAFYEESLIEV